MKVDELESALNEMLDTNRAADRNVDLALDVIRGRLRNASYWKLAALKRELRDYNINTKRWKS